MAWKAVHPSLTETHRIPDTEGAPVFEVGFLPPREAERLSVLLPLLKKPETLDPIKDHDEWIKATGLSYDVFRSLCRYGVRGWTESDLPPAKVEEVEIDGVKHPVLSDESIRTLGVNLLIASVGMKAWVFNMFRGDQKKTSNSPSDSSS